MSHRSKRSSGETKPVDDEAASLPTENATSEALPATDAPLQESTSLTPPQTPTSAPLTTPAPTFAHHDSPDALLPNGQPACQPVQFNPPLPTFNGHDVDGWLRVIAKRFTVAGLTQTLWYQKAAEQCTGAAAHVVRTEVGTSHTWDNLCKVMRRAFRPPQFEVEARHRLRQLKLERLEPVALYAHAEHFGDLAEDAGLSDKEAISTYIGTLPQELRMYLQLHCSGVDEWHGFFRKACAYVYASAHTPDTSVTAATPTSDPTPQTIKPVVAVQTRPPSPTRTHHGQPQQRPSLKPSSSSHTSDTRSDYSSRSPSIVSSCSPSSWSSREHSRHDQPPRPPHQGRVRFEDAGRRHWDNDAGHSGYSHWYTGGRRQHPDRGEDEDDRSYSRRWRNRGHRGRRPDSSPKPSQQQTPNQSNDQGWRTGPTPSRQNGPTSSQKDQRSWRRY